MKRVKIYEGNFDSYMYLAGTDSSRNPEIDKEDGAKTRELRVWKQITRGSEANYKSDEIIKRPNYS